MATTLATSTRPARHLLRRRLLPLYAAAFLQNLALWVPIEKLFMTTIGFNSASVGSWRPCTPSSRCWRCRQGCWQVGGVDVAC